MTNPNLKLFALTLAAIPAFGYSQSNNIEHLRNEVYTTNQPKIEVWMNKNTKDIQVSFDAYSDDRGTCWLDANYNGVYDEGEEITIFDDKIITYPTTGNKLAIYGNILRTNLAMCDLMLTEFSQDHPLQLLNIGVNYDLHALDITMLHDLEELYINRTDIRETLDLSHAPNIKKVDLSDSQFTGLKLPQGAKMDYVYMDGSKVSEADFSVCDEIGKILCSGCGLSKIDISNFETLTCLKASWNALTEIDLSNNPLLNELYLNSNELTTVDFSANPKLLWCNVSENKLESLDFSKNPDLQYVWAFCNKIIRNSWIDTANSIVDLSSKDYSGTIWVADTFNPNDENICNSDAVKLFNDRKWNVCDNNGGYDYEYVPYPGLDIIDPSAIESIENNESGVSIASNGGMVEINLPESLCNLPLTIYNMNGSIVYGAKAMATQSVRLAENAVYVATVGDKTFKFAVK